MKSANLPVQCPSCGADLLVRRCICPACQTEVEGAYELPPLARLSAEEQTLVAHLVLLSGSLKDLAKEYGVSYPTIRNRLDALREKLNHLLNVENPEGSEQNDKQ